MRIFVVSDTHDCPESELALIAKEAAKRNCECIIHCGDLINEHFGHPALGNLPIWVIRTNENENLPAKTIKGLPKNWQVLKDSDDQIIEFRHVRIYINHYLGVEVLRSNLGIPTPESETAELIDKAHKAYGLWAAQKIKNNFWGRFIRRKKWPRSIPFEIVQRVKEKFGNIRYVLFGHSHHQFFHVNYNTALVNPGAFGVGFDDKPKRSYAIIDTPSWDITFSKVLI